MIKKIHLITIFSFIAFFACIGNAKAEFNKPLYDTCCAPDSLRVVSLNYPVFCVSWQVRTDSICPTPQAFEIRWRPLASQIWKTKTVTYTSGTTINFCDSVDTCGTHVWQVRTKCNDSTYSDWVSGPKFTFQCNHDGPNSPQQLSISPNPAFSNVTITAKNIKAGLTKISIVNINGKLVFEKTLNTKIGNQLRENISVSEWQQGIYFIRILNKGIIIGQGSFVKE